MDARSPIGGSGANVVPILFKNLNNSIQMAGDETVGDGTGVLYNADIAFLLDSPSFTIPFTPVKGVKRKWGFIDEPANPQFETFLGLCLGHSSTSSDSKGSTATAYTSQYSTKESDEESSMDFTIHLGGEKSSGAADKSGISELKSLNALPNVDLQLSLSSGSAISDVTTVFPFSTYTEEFVNIITANGALNREEGSTGSPLLPLPVSENIDNSLNLPVRRVEQTSITPDISLSTIAAPKSSVTCSSGITYSQRQRSSGTKQCQFQGCLKGARGASGRCISHGGGRRCQRPGCLKGAEGRTAFCKAHGGGRRCEFLGCTKSAEGRTDFCIAHGGGRRCNHDTCSRAARGKSGLCIRHGGGKRCQRENCTKSAEGLSGLCISHGGGRRCQYHECGKGAQGSTMFCKAHGGGKRCTYIGCSKGAEGSTSFCKGHGGGKRCLFQGGGLCPKSVHGGTLFCVAHGGGKRCAVAECMRSARGRTDFCVRHGGGKRCKTEGCGKSAQGSTDFCKAHGGGKKCCWGHPDCEFGTGDGPCSLFARGKNGLCAPHSALVHDKRIHGGATVGTVFLDSKANQTGETRQILTFADTNVDITMRENSVVACGCSWNCVRFEKAPPVIARNRSSNPVPEGRVHGGNLMAAYACNHGFAFASCRGMACPLASKE